MSKIDISYYQTVVNDSLKFIYKTGPESMVHPIHYVLTGGGKRLRPILTLFSAMVSGSDYNIALPSAIAMEILHNFTLVHDDIMDDDNLRHGYPTVHNKWDIGTAILTGDAMVSLAFMELCKTKADTRIRQIEVFIDGLLAVCEGQALDKEFETRENVTLDEYINMIDLKTGHLLGLSAELGGLSAGLTQDCILRLRDYGRLIGRAFQIQDDYLEIFSNSDNMGKSLESDIILGKKTYLMIQAKEHNLNKILDAVEITKNDFPKGLEQIRNLLIQSGIKDKTEHDIQSIIKKADMLLENQSIDKTMLTYFSELILNRGH